MVARSWAERIMEDIYKNAGYDVISVGAPDFILLKNGRIEFVEIKTETDRPSEAQKRAIKLLKKHGFTARSEMIKHHSDHKSTEHHLIHVFRGIGLNKTFRVSKSYAESFIKKVLRR